MSEFGTGLPLQDVSFDGEFRRGGKYIYSASYGFSGEYLEYMKNRQLIPERGTVTGRAALDGKVVHIPDVFEDSQYTWWEAQKVGHFRAMLAVPLMREGRPIGVLIHVPGCHSHLSGVAEKGLRTGLFIRGGFSFGQLYHENGVVYGEAMVDACQFESSTLFILA
jgi:hypothetical protein